MRRQGGSAVYGRRLLLLLCGVVGAVGYMAIALRHGGVDVGPAAESGLGVGPDKNQDVPGSDAQSDSGLGRGKQGSSDFSEPSDDGAKRTDARSMPSLGDFTAEEQKQVKVMLDEVGPEAGLLKFSFPLLDSRSRTSLVVCEFVEVGSASVDAMLLTDAPELGLQQGEVVRLPYSQDWSQEHYKVRPTTEVRVGDRRTAVVRGFDLGIGWKRFLLHAGPLRE